MIPTMQQQKIKFSRGEVVVPNDNIEAAFRYTGPDDLVEGVDYRHPTDKELTRFITVIERDELVEFKNEKEFSKIYNDAVKAARKARSQEIGSYRSKEYANKIFEGK